MGNFIHNTKTIKDCIEIGTLDILSNVSDKIMQIILLPRAYLLDYLHILSGNNIS